MYGGEHELRKALMNIGRATAQHSGDNSKWRCQSVKVGRIGGSGVLFTNKTSCSHTAHQP